MTDTSVEQAKEASEDKSAATANETDELDALLAEFDQENAGTTEQTTETKTTEDTGNIAAQVEKLVKAQEARDAKDQANDFRKGVDEAIGWGMEVLKEKDIKAPEGTEKLFEGFLNTAATEDKRIAAAFMNRHQRPSAWKKVVVAKAGEFSKFFAASSDSQREQAAAAVAQSRSGNTKGQDFPSEQELGAMSDREFFKLARGMTGNM